MTQNFHIPASRTKATVIGGSGYVGRHVVNRLTSLGVQVTAPRRGNELQLLGTDLGELFYCAGMTSNYAANPVDTVQVHISLIMSLLDSCKYNSVVYLSSTRLYDRQMVTFQKNEAISENDFLIMNPKNMRHLYDLTKAVGENLCLHMASQKASIARLACVWDISETSTGFIPSLVKQLQKLSSEPFTERSISVNSLLSTGRHYIHVNDLVFAIIRMAFSEDHEQIVSLASDSCPILNSRVFSLLEEIYGIKIITPSESSCAKNSYDNLFLSPKLDLGAYRRLVGKDHVPRSFLTDLHRSLF